MNSNGDLEDRLKSAERPIVLDLFSGTGSGTQAFRESDKYDVIGIDIMARPNDDLVMDIMNIRASMFRKYDIRLIWASPPCVSFSKASNKDNWRHKEAYSMPKRQEAFKGIQLVYKTLYIVECANPDFWFMENPKGELEKVLGRPQAQKIKEFKKNNHPKYYNMRRFQGYITLCSFGHDYMKPTMLYGDHPRGFNYKYCGKGRNCHNSSPRGGGLGIQGKSDHDSRSNLPRGLSEHIKECLEAE